MKIAFLGDTAFIGKYYPKEDTLAEVKNRLRNIKSILADCDYVVANVETAITRKKATYEFKTMALRTDPRCTELLTFLGVNIACVANNHIYDYGTAAVDEAVAALNSAGIQCVGLDNEGFLVEKDEEKAWLGAWCCYTTNAWHYFDDGKGGRLNTLSYKNMNTHIFQAKQQKAFPVLLAHWGEENTHFPRYEHVQLASRILTNEDALIVGHHPHVLQGIGEYAKGKAYFSIGNFCFDDCVSEKYGIELKQTTENKKGAACFLELHNGEAKSYIKTFRDNGDEIVIDDAILKDVENYSESLTKISNLELYERIRENEQNAAKSIRLGKRDMNWILHHLNFTSIMAVMQRKKNQKHFSCLREDFKDGDSSVCGKEKVILYVGNFESPTNSAAGKRVYGNKLLLEKCGYKVKMIGKRAKENSEAMGEPDFSYFPSYGMRYVKKYIQWLDEYQNFMNVEPICMIRYGSPTLAWFDKLLQDYGHKRNIPVIADVVDWLSVDGGNIVFRLIKSFDTWLEKDVFNRNADGLIVISQYLQQVYRKNKNVLVLPPLVLEYLPSHAVASETVKIVYAGTPFRKGIQIKNPHKIKDRLDLAVEALIRASTNVKLLFSIYGITKEEYLVAFPQQRELVEQSNAIRFMGKCPMDVVQTAVNEADYTILLRERNRATMAGFPTKVVESLSLGTPVITTRTSDLSSYITEGEQGFFVDIGDIEQLCKQLQKILTSDATQRRKIQMACVNKKNFTVDEYLEDTKCFLQKMKI